MSPRPDRVGVSIAPSEKDALARLAHAAGEPLATTAGRLLRAALADHGAQLDQPPARRAGPTRTRRPKAPAPAAAPAAEAIERLRARYPHDLRHAPADLTVDNLAADMLRWLADWRERLDTNNDHDPREGLAFAHALLTAARTLQDRARRSR